MSKLSSTPVAALCAAFALTMTAACRAAEERPQVSFDDLPCRCAPELHDCATSHAGDEGPASLRDGLESASTSEMAFPEGATPIGGVSHLAAEELLSMEPTVFLEHLRRSHGWVTIWDPVEGWVERGDVEALLPLLHDDSPCVAVVSAYSSSLPARNSSTVGREAAFLIEAHRSGVFPPCLVSTIYFDYDTSEIEAWWADGGTVDGGSGRRHTTKETFLSTMSTTRIR